MATGLPANLDTASMQEVCERMARSSPQVVMAMLTELTRRFKGKLPPFVLSVFGQYAVDEDRYRESQFQSFRNALAIAAVAAQFSSAQLIPVGAAQVRVTDLWLGSSVLARVQIRLDPLGGNLGLASVVVAGAAQNVFPGAAAPTAGFTAGTNAGPFAGDIVENVILGGNVMIHLEELGVVPAGYAFTVVNPNANQDLTVNIRWNETTP